MADIEVIYDPAKEMAAIINLDTRQGWGPAMIGEEAGQLLTAFIEAVPFDITQVPPDVAAEAFAGFLDGVAAALADAPAEAPTGALESPDGPGVGEGASEPIPDVHGPDLTPPAQPADPDPDAGAAPAVQVVPCPACNGEGTIDLGDGEPPVRCNMCQGTKVIAQAL